MNLRDYLESIKQRDSFADFTKKYPKHLSDAEEIHGKYVQTTKEILAANQPQAEALKTLQEPFAQARKKINDVATLKSKGWVKTSGTDEEFKAAQEAYQKASDNYKKFLKGETKVTLAGGEEVHVAPELKEVYKKASESVGKIESALESWFGMARIEGAGNAAKHNLQKMNPFNKERPKAATGELFTRGVSVVAGGAMLVDAFARCKGKDDEARNAGGRWVEGLVGAGAIAGGLLVGKAR